LIKIELSLVVYLIQTTAEESTHWLFTFAHSYRSLNAIVA